MGSSGNKHLKYKIRGLEWPSRFWSQLRVNFLIWWLGFQLNSRVETKKDICKLQWL